MKADRTYQCGAEATSRVASSCQWRHTNCHTSRDSIHQLPVTSAVKSREVLPVRESERKHPLDDSTLPHRRILEPLDDTKRLSILLLTPSAASTRWRLFLRMVQFRSIRFAWFVRLAVSSRIRAGLCRVSEFVSLAAAAAC